MTDRVQIQPSSTNGAEADLDSVETTEWLEAIDAVVSHDGPGRARQLLARVVDRAQRVGTGPIATLTTPYVNTIPADQEPPFPGDPKIERRLRSIVRWNAIAMVVRANKISSELGGHIASYQSLAALYEVGYNHFWHAPDGEPDDPGAAQSSTEMSAARRGGGSERAASSRPEAERAASPGRAISSTSRATPRRATTRAHFSREG